MARKKSRFLQTPIEPFTIAPIVRRPRTASVVLGGGTPKTFINQASVQADFYSSDVSGHRYAPQKSVQSDATFNMSSGVMTLDGLAVPSGHFEEVNEPAV